MHWYNVRDRQSGGGKIFLLAFDVAIVSSYFLYKSYLKRHGIEQKSHYTYCEDNFNAWIDTDLHWKTRYQTKRKAEMKLIAESSAGLH